MTENEQRRTFAPSSLRWPIHFQLLAPMVSVVLLASFLATGITALWIARRVRNDQIANLDRVASTLGEAVFPLTAPVLSQVKGFSGAEFVLVGADGTLRETTFPIERGWLDRLGDVRLSTGEGRRAGSQVIALGGHNFLVQGVQVEGRLRSGEASTLWILYPEDQLTSRVYQA
ncbi:MAG: hypothetical protein GX594_18155, partial [Pirellulaceae bacterium]|nr:hypothetical protein [Pirellulaceae bacterium]